MRAGGLQKWNIAGGELMPLTTSLVTRSFSSHFLGLRQGEAPLLCHVIFCYEHHSSSFPKIQILVSDVIIGKFFCLAKVTTLKEQPDKGLFISL